ncbi:TetR/AcrR family transcriptional regulator [Pseudalkalibacillus caeni]|nr:TetR/AcrR family transcriptional regulator [Pseudalkalibacillus caeni]
MKEWIPIPGSVQERLIKIALADFCSKGYKKTSVSQIASQANVTTGAIYHHFGSKDNLYLLIRKEIEQRIADRMEGAASLFEDPSDRLQAALVTAYNSSFKLDAEVLLSEENPVSTKEDPIYRYLDDLSKNLVNGLSLILISAFRSTLKGVCNGELSMDEGKKLIEWLCRKSPR